MPSMLLWNLIDIPLINQRIMLFHLGQHRLFDRLELALFNFNFKIFYNIHSLRRYLAKLRILMNLLG